MKKHAAPPEEKGESAPIWIISFADMISLLMAFFVMLLTMSTSSRSGKLCEEGAGLGVFKKTLGSFRSSIAGFGVSGLFSKRNIVNLDSEKTYYNFSGGDSSGSGRIIDAREEKIRRVFKKLSGRAQTLKSPIQGSRPAFTVLPITFEQGQAVLSETSQQFLSKFKEDFEEAGTVGITAVYVVGLAPQETSEKQQWVVSIKRAQAVADFLKSNLSSKSQLPIYSWGAGPGGCWVNRDAPVSEQSQILIAVLRASD